MLVTFRSKVGDITMFGEVAAALLKLMGQSGGVPGAVLADDVPAALAALRSALATHGTAPATPAKARSPAEDRDAEPPIALSTRAKPLVDLLDSAARARVDVTWGA